MNERQALIAGVEMGKQELRYKDVCMIGKMYQVSSCLVVMRSWERKLGREPIVCLSCDNFSRLFYMRGGSVGGDLGSCS